MLIPLHLSSHGVYCKIAAIGRLASGLAIDCELRRMCNSQGQTLAARSTPDEISYIFRDVLFHDIENNKTSDTLIDAAIENCRFFTEQSS